MLHGIHLLDHGIAADENARRCFKVLPGTVQVAAHHDLGAREFLGKGTGFDDGPEAVR